MGSIKAIQLSIATDLKEIANEYRIALVAFEDQASKLKSLKSSVESKRQNAVGMLAKYGASSKELGVDPYTNKDYEMLNRMLTSPTLNSSIFKAV